MYYLGIDVHKRDSYIAVLNDDGDVVEEVRVPNANLDDFAQQYAGSEAAIEATSNYYTIYDRLSNHLDVVVADPYQTKATGSAEVKNDRLDAKLLTQLRRAGMTTESYVPPDEIRERRALSGQPNFCPGNRLWRSVLVDWRHSPDGKCENVVQTTLGGPRQPATASVSNCSLSRSPPPE